MSRCAAICMHPILTDIWHVFNFKFFLVSPAISQLLSPHIHVHSPTQSQTQTSTASPWTTAHTATTTPPSPNTQLYTLAPQLTGDGFVHGNETENAGRPKQEIHPPPPKNLPYADVWSSAVGQSRRTPLMSSCSSVWRFWIKWDASNTLPLLALSPNQLVRSNLSSHCHPALNNS